MLLQVKILKLLRPGLFNKFLQQVSLFTTPSPMFRTDHTLAPPAIPEKISGEIQRQLALIIQRFSPVLTSDVLEGDES